MKKLLSVLFLIPCVAFADIQIPEGSIKQDSCEFLGDIQNWQYLSSNVGGVASSRVVNVINKIMPGEKPISIGDTIFYAKVAVKNNSLKFKAPSTVIFKGRRFIDANYEKVSGNEFSVRGTISKGNVTFTLLELLSLDRPGEFVVAAVGKNGYFCSGAIARSIVNSSGVSYPRDYDVYQKEPLVRIEDPLSSSEQAISISLAKIDDVTATINIKLLVGGRVTEQKEIQVDAMSGYFQIASRSERLKVSFTKNNKNTIKVSSINEPLNYGDWIENIRYDLEHNINF